MGSCPASWLVFISLFFLALAACLAPSTLMPPLEAVSPPPPPAPHGLARFLLKLIRIPTAPIPPPPPPDATSAFRLALTFGALGCGLLVSSALLLLRPRCPQFAPQLPNASAERLFSPTEVDEMAVQRQLVTCNCSRVTSGVDMETASADFTEEEILGIDTLTTLDALGGLVASVKSAGSPTGSIPQDPGEGPLLPPLNNAEVHQLRLMNCYMREFLSKSHPLLGRAGPTCPFVPKALKLSSMRVAVLRVGANPSMDRMCGLVRDFIGVFERLEPQTGPTKVYKAILLLFPEIQLEDAPRLIDATQAALKAEFVSRGLMLGEFHLANNSRGLHNPNFYPLRTICPTLAIRHMVPQDLVFLTGDQYPPEKRVAFLRSYVSSQQDAKGSKAQEDLAQAKELLRELGGGA